MKNQESQVEPGRITRLHSEDETADFLAKWLDAFGKNRRGVNSKDFLWHIFSANRYPNVSGDEAVSQYKQQVAVHYVVLSNDRDNSFETDQLPDQCTFRDYYVFPRNLAWTMAFTHEDGWLGPYFARHPSFSALNDANVAGIKKAQEAQAAYLKGWR